MRTVTNIYYDTPFAMVAVDFRKWEVRDKSEFVMCVCDSEHAANYICEKLNRPDKSPFDRLFEMSPHKGTAL